MNFCDAELSFSIIGLEGFAGAVVDDYFYAREPVGLLTVDEMAEDGVGAPGARAFGRFGPDAGEIAKEGVEDCGGTFEDREAFYEKRADHMDMILIG